MTTGQFATSAGDSQQFLSSTSSHQNQNNISQDDLDLDLDLSSVNLDYDDVLEDHLPFSENTTLLRSSIAPLESPFTHNDDLTSSPALDTAHVHKITSTSSNTSRSLISIFILCIVTVGLLYGLFLTYKNIKLHANDTHLLSAIPINITDEASPSQNASGSSNSDNIVDSVTQSTTYTAPISLDNLTILLSPSHYSQHQFTLQSELYTASEEEITDDMNDIGYAPPEQTYYRREFIRSMINHAWDGYYNTCPGFDEVKPVSGKCYNWLQNGATAVDSSSLFLIVNDTKRYNETISISRLLDPSLTEGQQIEQFRINFKDVYTKSTTKSTSSLSSTTRNVSFFETTIRVLAGYLSQYELSKNPSFLRRAIETADALMPAFDHSASGFPFGMVDLITGKSTPASLCGNCFILADVGTTVLEFCGLTAAIHDYQDQLNTKYGISSPYNLKNVRPDWRDPTKSLYTNSKGDNILYTTLSSIYAPFEYCQRAHHVVSLLHAAAYTNPSSQHSGLYPQYLYPEPVTPLLFPLSGPMAIDQLQPNLNEWYSTRSEAMKKLKKASPQDGYYTRLSQHQSQTYLPFSPIMFLQSIHSYNATNTTIPDMYVDLAKDWVHLFQTNPSRLYQSPLSPFPDSINEKFEVNSNQGRPEKKEAIDTIIAQRDPNFVAEEDVQTNIGGIVEEEESEPCGLVPTPTCSGQMEMMNEMLTNTFNQLYSPSRMKTINENYSTQAKLWSQRTSKEPKSNALFVNLPGSTIPTSISFLYNETSRPLGFRNPLTYSAGPMSDSLYEYFLKFWISSGKQNPIYLDLYLKSVRGVFELIYREYTPSPADLKSLRDSRHLNRLYDSNATSIKYPTSIPTTIETTFHRPDQINYARGSRNDSRMYPPQDYLNNRTREWDFHESLNHDIPPSQALSNPRTFNRVMKWLSSQPYGMLVDGQNFSKIMLTEPLGKTGSSIMNHLSCFFPGTLALGLIHNAVPLADREDHLMKAESMIRGCVRGYLLNPYTGLAPEVYRVNHLGTFQLNSQYSNFNLRPETLESLYLLWRYTGNQVYRELAWLILENINRYCRARLGFTSLKSVFARSLDDRQETFLLAEVLKYGYLLFEEGEKEPIDVLDKIKIPYNLNFTQFKPAHNGQNKEKSTQDPFSIYFDSQKTASHWGIQRASETGLYTNSTSSTPSKSTAFPVQTDTTKPIKPRAVSKSNTHNLFDLTKFVFNTEAHVLPIRELHIDTMLLESLSSEKLQEYTLHHSPPSTK